jgi:FkbM family methyltransferase
VKHAKGNPSDWVRHVAKPGDVVIDGGANKGGFTKAAAEAVGSRGRVFAIEPDPRCHGELDALALTLPQVTVLPVALDYRKGVTTLRRAKHPEQSSLYETAVKEPLDTLEVQTLVKLDLQGAEPDVILGGSGLLGRCPNWCVEIWPHALQHRLDFLLWAFANFDYSLRWMDAGYPEGRFDELRAWAKQDLAAYQHINVIFTHV